MFKRRRQEGTLPLPATLVAATSHAQMGRDMDKSEFMTESGIKLKLVPFRMALVEAYLKKIEKDYRAAHPDVEVPTYQAKSAGGTIIPLPLDEKSLVDPADPVMTKVNQVRWAKHVQAKADMDEMLAEQNYLGWLRLGVVCDVPDDGWEATVEAFGVTVPRDDPAMRKAYWLHFVVLSPADREYLRAEMPMINAGKLVTDDQVDTFRRTLRSAVEGEATRRIDAALAEIERAVDRGGEVPGDAGGAVVGADAGAVGQPG